MATTDKTVKILITVDAQEAKKAENAIGAIKASVDALVESVKRLGGSGGLGGLLNVSNTAAQPGQSAQTQAKHAATGPVGQITAALTMGPAAGTQALKGFATQFETYAKSVKKTFEDLVKDQTAQISRLQQAWGKVKFPGGGGGGGGGAGGGGGGAGGGGGGAGGGSGQPGRGSFVGGLQGVGQSLGIPGWLMGTAGIAGMAAGAAGLMYGQFGASKDAQIRYDLEKPLLASRVQAEAAGSLSGNAMSLRHGDLARSWAMNEVKKDARYSEINSAGFTKKLHEKIQQETPIGLLDAAKTGHIGAVAQNFGDMAGLAMRKIVNHPWASFKQMAWSSASAVGSALGGGGLPDRDFVAADMKPGESMMRGDEVRRQESLTNHAADQVKARNEFISNFMASNKNFGSQLNEFYGGALGDMSLSRAAGISGKFIKRKDGTYGDSVADFNNAALGMGISGSELANLRVKMGGVAGFGFKGRGSSLLSPEAGGLSNAGEIFGVGAQYGGGGWNGAQSFMKGIQGNIGRGGLDVTAGAQVAGLGMGAMTSGRFQAGGGVGFMSTLMEAASDGTTGGDMRNARDSRNAFAAFDQGILGGNLDPLQKAMNYSAAMKVAGDQPWQTQQALANMDAATMMEVLRNPNSAKAGALRAKGVTADLLRNYFNATNSTSFARIVPSTLTDSAKQSYANFQAAGGSTKYMKGLVDAIDTAKNIKNPKKRKAALAEARQNLDTETRSLASLFEIGDQMDAGTAFMTVRQRMGMEGVTHKLHGKGAHRSDSMKSNRGQVLKTQGGELKKTGDTLATGEAGGHVVSQAVGNLGNNEDEENKKGKDAYAAGLSGDLDGTIDKIGALLHTFVSQLHGAKGGKAGPPGQDE